MSKTELDNLAKLKMDNLDTVLNNWLIKLNKNEAIGDPVIASFVDYFNEICLRIPVF